MTSAGTSETERAPKQQPSNHQTDSNVVSIAKALNGTQNSLGLIRLLLAALVIFDHAFPLGGWGRDPFWRLTEEQASLGSLAVAGFFAISGYLIIKSGMSGDVVQFLWKRSLRIFPAYWLVLLVTAFIAAPLIWVSDGKPLLELFTLSHVGPFQYIAANWTLNIGSYGIASLLTETTPYGQRIGASAFNGSIWTLIYEWNCYLIVAVMVAFGVLRKAAIMVPALAVGFLIMQILASIGVQRPIALAPIGIDNHMVWLGFTFLVGGVIAVYSHRVPYDWRLGLLAGVVLVASLRLGGFNTIGTVAGGYFVLFLAAWLPRKLQWIGKKNDYSYGVYIYGFLVQQVTAYFGVHHLGYFPYVAIALLLSFGCAWVSWHLVEKRAMGLKSRGPGLGVRYWKDQTRMRVRFRGTKHSKGKS